MDKEAIEKYKDVNVRIILSNGFTYNCDIKQIYEKSVEILDMYGNSSVINLEFIQMISPIKGGKNA